VKIDERNIDRRVLIGLRARVVRHPDPTVEGLEGIITWETSRTITLRTVKNGRPKEVKVLKEGALLALELDNGRVVLLEGFRVINRPESRAKRS